MIEPSSGEGGARQLTDGSRDFEKGRLVEENCAI
jgi:hypothetical protein